MISPRKSCLLSAYRRGALRKEIERNVAFLWDSIGNLSAVANDSVWCAGLCPIFDQSAELGSRFWEETMFDAHYSRNIFILFLLCCNNTLFAGFPKRKCWIRFWSGSNILVATQDKPAAHILLLSFTPLLLLLLCCQQCCYTPKVLHKVNGCLARYSPRATTTNQPTNRALNKPAWPSPNWPKLSILGQIWSFLGKKSFFLLEKSKVLLPT